MRPDPHVSDEELVMARDGELAAPRMESVSSHLSHCQECRGRSARFEQAISEYMSVHYTMAGVAVPPGRGPTARLRARLCEEEDGGGVSRWTAWIWGQARTSVLAGAVAVLLTPLAVVFWFSGARADAAGPLPDARMTPGAVRFISTQQVCVATPEDEGRLVPPDLALRVFEQYRIVRPKPGTWEVDYLISPALGGTTALQNLWPVPYIEGVWTSRVKDALEDHLRTLVCEGKIDLATAQREIANNWIAAYQKYFGTKTPIAEHARFVKDSPW